jgi:isopropylmalate/homocitrate/citramalate synthase
VTEPVRIGRPSSRAAFRHALDQLGIQVGPSAFEQAFTRTEELADRYGEIPAEQLRSIVEEIVSDIDVIDDVAATFA